MKDPVVLADDSRLQDGAMVSAVQRRDNYVAPGSAAPRTVGRSVDRVRSIESPLPALVPVARGPKPATRCASRGYRTRPMIVSARPMINTTVPAIMNR